MLRCFSRMSREVCTVGTAVVCLTACTPKANQRSNGDLTNFATRYAAAWSGKDPVKFAAFYEEKGSLTVNGAASVGRAAITATARAYMAAFPDMVVKLDSLRQEQDQTIFHWTGQEQTPVRVEQARQWTCAATSGGRSGPTGSLESRMGISTMMSTSAN